MGTFKSAYHTHALLACDNAGDAIGQHICAIVLRRDTGSVKDKISLLASSNSSPIYLPVASNACSSCSGTSLRRATISRACLGCTPPRSTIRWRMLGDKRAARQSGCLLRSVNTRGDQPSRMTSRTSSQMNRLRSSSAMSSLQKLWNWISRFGLGLFSMQKLRL
jgi:hypothetical protein